jgi:hypothetical protein
MTKLTSFKGNKSTLASKFCTQCFREMSWRKAWAKNWEEVKYCSDACRLKAKPQKKIGLAHAL